MVDYDHKQSPFVKICKKVTDNSVKKMFAIEAAGLILTDDRYHVSFQISTSGVEDILNPIIIFGYNHQLLPNSTEAARSSTCSKLNRVYSH
jgi:hypothetical protein